MRRLRGWGLTFVLTVVLVVGGGAAAHALWSITRPLPNVALTTGDFDLTATWDQAPDLAGLFPGDRVTGAGTVTLDSDASWQYHLDQDVEDPLAGYLTAVWYPNDTCTAPELTWEQLNGTTLPGGTFTPFCVRYTLDPDTPGGLQGAESAVSVTITAEQVRP